MSNRQSPQRLPRSEVIKVYEFLKTILIKKDDGTCEYQGDWTDERVASAFHTSIRAIENTRVAAFGLITKPQKAARGADPELVARVESLERRMMSLLSAMESQHKVNTAHEHRLSWAKATLDEEANKNAIARSELDRVLTKLASLLED